MTVDDPSVRPSALHGPGQLASLHVQAITVACPRSPKGCGQAAGDRCVNLSAVREAGAEQRDMRAPHPSRLRAAEGAVPAPREPEVPMPDEPPADDDEEYGDADPF